MKAKVSVIVALVITVVAPSLFADWYWKYSDKSLIQEGLESGTAWKFHASISGTQVTVGTGSLAATVTTGSDTELDFTKPVKNGDADCAIVGFDALCFKNNTTITKVKMPLTITSLGKQAFYGCSNLETIEPFLPESINKIGEYIIGSCPKLKGELKLLSPTISIASGTTTKAAFYGANGIESVVIGDGISSIGEAVFQKCDSLTNVVIGVNVTSIGKYAFYTDPIKTFVFKGNMPDTTTDKNSPIYNYAEKQCRCLVADNNESWKALINGVTLCTEAETNAYIATYGTEDSKLCGKSKVLGSNRAQFIATYSTAVVGSHTLTVTAEPSELGEPSPTYEEHVIDDGNLPQSCTAEEYVIDSGVRYHCLGSRKDAFVDGEWILGTVTNATANYSYEGGADSQVHRLVWIYEPIGYQAMVSIPDGIGTVEFSPAADENGCYLPNEEVQVTAYDGTEEEVKGTFVRWYGDVDAAQVSNRTISVTIDGAKTLKPYFRRPWKVTDATNLRISDGYWTLKYGNSGDDYTLVATISGGFEELDLAKGLDTGAAIVATTVNSLFANRGIETVTLPDNFTSFADKTFHSCSRLTTIIPKAIPDSVTYLGYAVFYGTGLTKVSLRGITGLSDGSSGGQQFTGCSALQEVELGKDVPALTYRMFRNDLALKRLTFLGGKPEANSTAFDLWKNYQVRIFVSRDNDDWAATIEDPAQVKKWADCTPEEKKKYTDAYPGERAPIGILLTYCANTPQWLCRIVPKAFTISIR